MDARDKRGHDELEDDREVLDFFRRGGRGYQTRINAVLRSYVASQQEEG